MEKLSTESRRAGALRVLALIVLASVLALACGREYRPTEALPPRPRLVLDANSAPVGLLTVLPDIGPARARAIVETRDAAPYRDLADLERRVKGIGPIIALRLKPFLRFARPAP